MFNIKIKYAIANKKMGRKWMGSVLFTLTMWAECSLLPAHSSGDACYRSAGSKIRLILGTHLNDLNHSSDTAVQQQNTSDTSTKPQGLQTSSLQY